MNTKTKRVLLVLTILIILTGILAASTMLGRNDADDTIDSFEECAAAGYPIMESYPEQCAVPGGQTFTKQY